MTGRREMSATQPATVQRGLHYGGNQMQDLDLAIRSNWFLCSVIALGLVASLQCNAQTAVQPNTVPGAAPAKTMTQLSDAKSIAQARAELARAITANTEVKKGKAFPARHATNAGSSSKTGSCAPTDTLSFSHVASISIASPNHTKKDNLYPDPEDREFYSAPPGWVVQTYSRIVDTAGPPFTAGDSSTPANFAWNSSATYSSVKTQMHSFVASLNIPNVIKADLNAKLDSLISNIASASYSISSSSAVLTHHAQVSGVGVINTSTSHSWYSGWLSGTLVCAPDYMYDQGALINVLKSWVTTTLHHTQWVSQIQAL